MTTTNNSDHSTSSSASLTACDFTLIYQKADTLAALAKTAVYVVDTKTNYK